MTSTTEDIPSVLDVAIIGAGQLDPDAKVAIFERDNSVGGTWSKERIYPNLVAQVEYGYFNYPGTPMPKDGATDHNLVSGTMIFNYLDRFASDHDLKRRIYFKSWVSEVERCDRGWKLTVNGRSVESTKLIIATGVTSVKNSPSFKTMEGSIPVIHSLDIARNAQDFSSNMAQHFLIVGAAKSAYDVVYQLCTMGKKVTWVIRPDGSGPMPIMPSEVLGMNTITLSCNRLTSYLSPSLMTTYSWLGGFFHRTVLGRWITKAHWNFITGRAEKAAGFGGNAGSVEGLRPDVQDASCFWCDSSIGLITMGDFWSTLKEGDITIVRDNVDIVDDSGALLRSGRRIDADRVIYCTGWGDHFSFFSEAMKEELGIPRYGVPSATKASSATDNWLVHDETADSVVARQLPLLASGPKDLGIRSPNRLITRRRWRLYNRCVPISTAKDSSIVILGQIHTTQTPTISAIQCLWAVAYLLGEVALPPEDHMVKEVAEWNAWTRKRYMGVGERYPYALFDWIPYLDRLLKDLGVTTQRKSGLLANFLAPHGPSDYANVLDEYLATRKEKN
ncbi:flavin-binding monooxygenase-like family protein [Xylaria bambusicola]|uniref:flavin-binding monooxygenase-like family protein n=1 Tax=Xylaria bambusicola TaxID=326684 RepID=UPI002007B23E|nr:flavin-binding monooxygenase-like family protein [Xylaria bambusicola]KAI0508530.1 flavin-binding monooxygenase-like family protein [Xylaria bambusicola]